jgi:hypothetical protein
MMSERRFKFLPTPNAFWMGSPRQARRICPCLQVLA